ncbi:MAG: hypothetical protein LC749_00770 [Actinobacteria bacterium]|nr:hypothetical protein [Actinomycetota bacterium]
MQTVIERIRGFYGAHPLHLLALLGCFALAGYAALQTSADPSWPTIGLWFLGAVIAHDLVLFPLYALADRSLSAGLRSLRPGSRPGRTPPRVPAVNYLRVPILGTGLLFLLFFPGIIQQGRQTYLEATGLTQEPYLNRWLLLTAAMFAISAITYAARLAYAHRGPAQTPSGAQDGGPGTHEPETAGRGR